MRNHDIEGHDHRWSDLSPQGAAELRSFWAGVRSEAATCPRPSAKEDVAVRVLLEECDVVLSGIDAELHLSDVNNIVSPWQNIRTIFASAPMESEVICY